MSYGARIRQAREAVHLTQEELAEQLEVSRQAVSKWEADKSRPAAGKLELLSQVLDIPMEDWTALDAEEADAARRADPTERKLHFWRRTSAALALGLCLALGGWIWTASAPAQAPPTPEETATPDPSVVFPDAISFHEEEFCSPGELAAVDPGNPADLPFLHNEAELEQHTIWRDFFGSQIDSDTVFLRAVKANPIRAENGTVFHDVYLLYEKGGKREILCRLAEDNHYITTSPDSSWQAGPFTHVLGADGFKLTLSIGLSVAVNCYVTLGEDGLPHVIACLVSGGTHTMDVDLNDDGEREIVSQGGGVPVWEVYARSGDAFSHSTLYSNSCGVSRLSFQPENGGFVVTDQQDQVLVRYLLGDGQLVRQPQTTYTAQDYPDAVSTVLHFPEGHPDPDEVLVRENGIRITRRQQVYLALQELFHLTGQLPEVCFCTVDRDGLVRLSAQAEDEDGFCQMQLGVSCGGGSGRIPGVELKWQEQGFASSPLHAVPNGLPYSSCPSSLSFYFDKLHFLAEGEVAQATVEELFLTDGSRFTGELLESESHQLLLLSLHGPIR